MRRTMGVGLMKQNYRRRQKRSARKQKFTESALVNASQDLALRQLAQPVSDWAWFFLARYERLQLG